MILPTLLRRGLPAYNAFMWFLRATKKNEVLDFGTTHPSVDLIWIVERKDFRTLLLSIQSAVKHTLNPVSSISVIVPDTQTVECQKYIDDTKCQFEISIIPESKVIPLAKIEKIKQKFPEKYGWILQQFLKLESVLKSDSAGVLIIDADTIILEDRLWLDQNLNQILMSAPWRHDPYFSFLNKLGLYTGKPRYSFVTHHMLMQPSILQEAIMNFGFQELHSFIEFLLEELNDSNVIGFSIDYEFYGNYLHSKMPKKTKLTKFCNLSMSSNLDLPSLERLIKELEDLGEYRSISLHSWNS